MSSHLIITFFYVERYLINNAELAHGPSKEMLSGDTPSLNENYLFENPASVNYVV